MAHWDHDVLCLPSLDISVLIAMVNSVVDNPLGARFHDRCDQGICTILRANGLLQLQHNLERLKGQFAPDLACEQIKSSHRLQRLETNPASDWKSTLRYSRFRALYSRAASTIG